MVPAMRETIFPFTENVARATAANNEDEGSLSSNESEKSEQEEKGSKKLYAKRGSGRALMRKSSDSDQVASLALDCMAAATSKARGATGSESELLRITRPEPLLALSL